MKNIYVFVLLLLLLVSCTKNSEVDNNLILKENNDILNEEVGVNESILIGSELNIKLDECLTQEEYVACYSNVADMNQYFFMKDAFNNISNDNEIKGDEKITIEQAKIYFNQIYKNHEEKGLSVFTQDEYMGKYDDKAILGSRTIYPHGLKRYMFLSKESLNTAITQANELYKNTDKIEKDTAVLSDIEYEQLGNYVKIVGNKYSNLKNINKDFYVILGVVGGDIKIIEEFSSTT